MPASEFQPCADGAARDSIPGASGNETAAGTVVCGREGAAKARSVCREADPVFRSCRAAGSGCIAGGAACATGASGGRGRDSPIAVDTGTGVGEVAGPPTARADSAVPPTEEPSCRRKVTSLFFGQYVTLPSLNCFASRSSRRSSSGSFDPQLSGLSRRRHAVVPGQSQGVARSRNVQGQRRSSIR